MGNSYSKNTNLERDEKYMNKKHPGSTDNLQHWKKHYGFQGKLTPAECELLVCKIRGKTKGDASKQQKEGLEAAKIWLGEARRRCEDIKKSKAAKKENAEKEEQNMLKDVGEDDVSVVPTPLPVPPPQAPSGPPPDYHNHVSGLYPPLPPEIEGAVSPYTPRITRSITRKDRDRNYNPDNPEVESCPLIEVPSPRAGQDDGTGGSHPNTMFVCRVWTDKDVQEAIGGLTPHKTCPEKFFSEFQDLVASFRLNGRECERALRKTLGPDWVHVCGDWNPNNANGEALPHGAAELTTRLTSMKERIEKIYEMKKDPTVIARTTQKDGEAFEDYYKRMEEVFRHHSGIREEADQRSPYQQQLKLAIHRGSLPAVKSFVEKHMVSLPSADLTNYLDYAIHAEKVMIEKKKKKSEKIQPVFIAKDTLYSREGRGRGRGRGRYVDRNRSRNRNDSYPRGQRTDKREDECYNCGKMGHWARDCRSFRKNKNRERDFGQQTSAQSTEQERVREERGDNDEEIEGTGSEEELNLEEILMSATEMPQIELLVNGQKITFFCDTGVGWTVLRDNAKGACPSGFTILVRSAKPICITS